MKLYEYIYWLIYWFSPASKVWVCIWAMLGIHRKCVAENSTLYFPLCHSRVFPPPLVTFYSTLCWSGCDLPVHSVGSKLTENVITVSCRPRKPSWGSLLNRVQSLWLCMKLWRAQAVELGPVHVWKRVTWVKGPVTLTCSFGSLLTVLL